MVISKIVKSEVDYIKLDESIKNFEKENNRLPYIIVPKNIFETMYKDGVFWEWTEPFSFDNNTKIVSYHYLSCEVFISCGRFKDGEIILL